MRQISELTVLNLQNIESEITSFLADNGLFHILGTYYQPQYLVNRKGGFLRLTKVSEEEYKNGTKPKVPPTVAVEIAGNGVPTIGGEILDSKMLPGITSAALLGVVEKYLNHNGFL